MENSIDWSTWYDSFKDALADADYDFHFHLGFDFIGSEGEAARLVEKAILALYNKGLSPEEVVVELEDRLSRWYRQHGAASLRASLEV